MIGKQKIGKTFTPLLNYLFSKQGASLIGGNMIGENAQELAAEFLFSKQLNPRVEKPVYHATLSVPCGEYIPDAKWRAIALDYLEGMGLDQNLFAIIRHTDREHDHIHIAASRIKLDEKGTCVSDSWNYLRSEKLIQELEEKYDLTPASRSFDKERRSPTTGERRRLARTGEISTREQLQTALDRATTDRPALALLIDRLSEQGISVKIKPTPAGKLGISYKLENIAFSGTHLGKAYTFKGLQKYKGVSYFPDIDSEVVAQFPTGTSNQILQTGKCKPDGDGNTDSDTTGNTDINSTGNNNLPPNRNINPDIYTIEEENTTNISDVEESATDSSNVESEDVSLDEPLNQETNEPDLTLHWQSVRERLVENACLPSELIDLLHDKGWIDIDDRACAVFTLRTLTGDYMGTSTWESNGTFSIGSNAGISLGKDSDQGIFWIATQNDIERAVIASNPVEILSAIALDPDFDRRPTLYLSIDAISSLPTKFLIDIPAIVVGLKGDEFGEKLSQEIIEILPQAKRINPGIGGWNEILVAQVQEMETQSDELDETGDVPEKTLRERNSGLSLD
ncbi:relaxase/mobilization nuclease domain-containing protein [Kamptonema sp. UHCC 0994]|uniref:relaxase/mobilization nuclease domain-containing protein n=1 Tax=Kamptonema sp. UHCC 0994 TaxID=3031329 RepID=UPI0023B91FEB|nr:relaxase/mobilization nuclease domain-containing protein [Kamptonema sp. UHCC 0994]MDF0555937.1 relaxase/mobilization nuclease domain-containing protein [Kamptonema sp. UHCC 0994]